MSPFEIMLRNVLVFVALAIPGYILVKTKLMGENSSGVLSKTLTYFGMPFLILSSTLNVSFSSEFTVQIIKVAVVGILFTVGLFFLSAFLVKKEDEKKRQGMARFCMVFSNNGFLGIPLAKAVFADSPVVTYLIILNIITNVLMFTLGVYLISGDKSTISLKKALLNPILIAFIIGIIFNLTKVVTYVPEISVFSNHFSNIVTPLSMTILGMKMAGVQFVALFKKPSMYFVSSIKLVAVPVLAVACMFLLRLVIGVSDEMILGVFIALAVPTAGLASAFSDRYDGDTENAVAFTLGSTILSIATIPVLYWLLCLILG